MMHKYEIYLTELMLFDEQNSIYGDDADIEGDVFS